MRCLFFLLILFYACHRKQYFESISQKGYGSFADKDTVIIKPHEFFWHSKHYYPVIQECEANNPLEVKFSIRGYENSDTIPSHVLYDSLSISLSDTTIKEIVKGQLLLLFEHSSKYYRFKNDMVDTKILFLGKKPHPKSMQKPHVLFNFCFSVRKGGTVHQIPSRKYIIKPD